MARLESTRAKPAFRTAPPMQQALRRALAPILKEAGPAAVTLASRWPEIVGERLAKVSEPLRVQPGKGGATLLIRAPSTAAPMIQHVSGHIMERVGLATGSKIKAIRITQTAAAATAVKATKPVQRELTAEERTRIAGGIAQIQTPAVKQALERLGKAVLTWKA